MDLHLWATFCVANLLTSLLPGPGAMAAINAGAGLGRQAAYRLVAGLQLALLSQLAVVALGAGALLAASALAFKLLRWAGAAYLVWLGISHLRAAWLGERASYAACATASVSTGLLRRGMLVNFANPKAMLFMAALVPQFIVPERTLATQYAIIALTMCGIDSVVMGAYATLAAQLRPWFEAERTTRWRNAVFGCVFVVFGILLARFGKTA
jgi:homoserine/homoserine lactone efflux protein